MFDYFYKRDAWIWSPLEGPMKNRKYYILLKNYRKACIGLYRYIKCRLHEYMEIFVFLNCIKYKI